jgi:hypothetical protein
MDYMNNTNTNNFNEFDTFTYGDEFYEKLERIRNTNNSDNNFNNFGSITGPDYSFENTSDYKQIELLQEREREFERKKLEEQLKIEKQKRELEKREAEVKDVKEVNDYLTKKNSELLEDKDINAEFLCVICLTDTKNCLLEPCGHLATCIECYKTGKLKKCPCCRTTITNMRKIFI